MVSVDQEENGDTAADALASLRKATKELREACAASNTCKVTYHPVTGRAQLGALTTPHNRSLYCRIPQPTPSPGRK